METEYRTPKWQWVIAAILIAIWIAGTITVMLHTFNERRTFVAHTMYYVLSIAFIAWAMLLLQDARTALKSWRQLWMKYRLPIVLAGLLTASIVVSGRFGLKVLSDETNIVAVSKSFFHDKTMYNITMADWYYENFHPTNREFPKRPAMFPYMLSLLHAVLGYSLDNAYVLNMIILFSLLLFVGVHLRRHMGAEWTTVGLLFIMAQPMLVTCATSAGFDLLSALFFCLTLGAAVRHMKHPSAETLLRFWFTGIVWAFVRYETGLFVGIIAVFMVIRGYVKWSFLKRYLLAYAIGPIFITYRAGQVLLTAHQMENKNEDLLSLGYITRNVSAFMKHHLEMSASFPHNLILNWLGIAALLVLGYLLVRGRIAPNNRPLRDGALVTVLATCGLQFLFFCHHVGRYAHPSQNRFFLIYCLMAAIGAVWLLHRYVKLPRFMMVAFAFVLLGAHLPTSQDDRFNLKLTLTRKTYYTHEYIKENARQNVLIVVDRPGQYTVLDRGAMNFRRANDRRKGILRNLKRNLYEDIWVIQDIEYKTGKPKKGHVLKGRWDLETLTEIQITAGLFVRISRVLPSTPTAMPKKKASPKKDVRKPKKGKPKAVTPKGKGAKAPSKPKPKPKPKPKSKPKP